MNANWNWTPLLMIGGVALAVFLLKRAGQISAKDALAHLKNGAMVIDVRSPGEFRFGSPPSRAQHSAGRN